MEELKLNSAAEMPLICGESTERIKPDEAPIKRRKSIYILFTVSVFIFILAFALSDIGYKVLTNGTEHLPSILVGSVFGENEGVEISFSEHLSRSILGIRKISAVDLPVLGSEENTDELSNDGGNSQNKAPIAADTTHETSSDIINETSDTETEAPESVAPQYPIIAMDLCQRQLGEYYIGNETGYTPDVKSLLQKEYPIPEPTEDENSLPLVLIIHTHGTESYSPEGSDSYTDDGSDISRSEDKERNVIHIGSVMTETLISKGINTIHCDIMHDEESYQDSYTRASETIREYLAKYPSIKYVFDVHRDAIMSSDGSLVKAVTEIEGESVAQVMTVVGSNYKGANFPNWEDHLSLALKLKAKLDQSYDSLSRPVYLRGAAYNQQYTSGSLLLEIGTSGNTLAEAERAAILVAEALADLISNRK